MKDHTPTQRKGFTLIEVVLGVGILTMFFLANALYYEQARRVSEQTTRRIQSGFLLEEGVEAVKLMRDAGWSARVATLTNGTRYYLHWDGSAWLATTTPEQIENIFTRFFVLSPVERDAGDNIVSSGGVLDPGSRKAVVTVEWDTQKTASSSESIETYITNLFNN